MAFASNEGEKILVSTDSDSGIASHELEVVVVAVDTEILCFIFVLFLFVIAIDVHIAKFKYNKRNSLIILACRINRQLTYILNFSIFNFSLIFFK